MSLFKIKPQQDAFMYLPLGQINGGNPSIDPSHYVKKTDYATSTSAGIVKISSQNGINITPLGALSIQKATESDIDAKQDDFKPIVPSNLEYAVGSVTYNKLEIDTALAGKMPATTKIPGALADLADDSEHRVVTDTEKAAWNAKSNFSGSYNDLVDKPFIPSVENFYVIAGQKAGTTLGNHATAEGTDTTASAHEAHAEGKYTQALGQASHAEGYTTVAGDSMAHAEGYYSKATGYASHAQGMHTKATASASSASGYRTEANSSRQFVIGTLNKNSSGNAFEVGRGVPYFNDISDPDPVDLVPEKSFPFNAFEVGVFGQARAESFATKDSVLNNDFSLYDESKNPKTVLGTIVTGTQSIGIGGQRYDKGPDDLQDDPQALVEGNQAIAVGGSNIVHGHWSGSFGKNNENFQCAGFTFGGGNTAGIPEENWKTEEYPYEATDTKEYSKTYSFAFASGESNHAYGRASVAMGRRNDTYGLRSIGLGNQNTAKGEASIAIGFGNTSTGKGSVAAGLYAVASGDGSHAEGNSTAAAAAGAHAEGNSTVAVGNHTHAEGYQTTAKGTQAHAEGFSTNKYVAPSTENINNIISLWGSTKFALAYGSNSHTEGKDTLALSGNAHAEGDGSIAQGASAHAQGYRTKAQGNYSHAEGNQSVAMGSQSHAQGYKSQAIGDNSYASGIASYANSKTSFAHGDHVTADAESQVVFGKYNAVDSNALLIVGNGSSSTKKNAFVVKNDSIMIGNTTLTETQLIKILNFIESIEG